MKYKVGDKITLRSDLVDGKTYGCDIFLPPMAERLGKTLIIEDIKFGRYKLIDGGGWNYTEEMFEPSLDTQFDVTKQTIISIKDGILKVQYTTNTKKNNISIQRTGSRIGKIKLDEIDKLIGLLTKLKSEV